MNDLNGAQDKPRRPLLSQRFLLSLLMLTVIGALAIIQALAIQRSGVQNAELARSGVLERAQLVAAAHDQWLSESRNLLAAMASALGAFPASKQGCTRLFKDFIERAKGFDTVLLANPAGELTCAPMPVTRKIDFADRGFFNRVMATKQFSAGEYIVGRVSGKRVLPVALPLLDDAGEVTDVVIAGRELDSFGSILRQQAFLGSAQVTILDEKGIVLGRYPGGGAELEKPYPDHDVLAAVQRDSSGVVDSELLDNDPRVVGFTRLGQAAGNVHVLVSVSRVDAMAPVDQFVQRGKLFLALTMSVVLVTLWAGLGTLVLQPMERLRLAIKRASRGDLSVRLGDMGLSSEMRAISSDFDAMAAALGEARQHLEQLATIDPLLNIANRRKFDEILEMEWLRARRAQKPIALIMIDLDRFKQYNDRYGHPAGDDCLKRVAKAVDKAIRRPGDLLARYGGEELVCILPETDLDGAVTVSEGIRANVNSAHIIHQDGIGGRVTVSIGVGVALPDGTVSPEDLMGAADRALYNAKNAGRDRLETYPLSSDLKKTGSGD